MNKILSTFIVLFVLLLNVSVLNAETQSSELPECEVITHCVKENWKVNDVKHSFRKAVEAVSNTPRTKIVEETDSFLHAEAQTKWRRYTDDLLIKALPERGVIQVRSESRIGIGDNGVNQKRVDDLAYRLTTNQIN